MRSPWFEPPYSTVRKPAGWGRNEKFIRACENRKIHLHLVILLVYFISVAETVSQAATLKAVSQSKCDRGCQSISTQENTDFARWCRCITGYRPLIVPLPRCYANGGALMLEYSRNCALQQLDLPFQLVLSGKTVSRNASYEEFFMLSKSLYTFGLVVPMAMGLLASAAQASNVITNPNFATGPTNPPTPNDWQYGGGAAWDSANPYVAGSGDANLNNTAEGNNADVFQQTAVGTITPNTTYTFSFYSQFTGVGAGYVGQAQLQFLNSSAGALGAPTFVNFPATTSGFGTPAGYQLSSVNIVAPTGASEAYINLGAITGAVAGSSAHAYIGEVSLAPVATPEPASVALLGLGVVGLLALRKRKAMY